MSGSRAARRTSLGAKVFLACASVALSTGVAELLARWLHPAPTIFPVEITTGNGDHALSLNPRLVYQPRPGSGELNRQGFRGKEVPQERVPGKTRVVFVGDSVVEGWGVKADRRFTDVLAAKLGEGYEVINLAVRGYNLEQEVEYLSQAGVPFRPDIVLFGITANDLEPKPGGEIAGFTTRLAELRKSVAFSAYYGAPRARRALLRSHLYRHWVRFAMSRAGQDREADDGLVATMTARIDRGRLQGLLAEVKSLAATRGFRPVFLFLPLPEPAPQLEEIRSGVQAAGIQSVDLYAPLMGGHLAGVRPRLFLDECHLTEAGHAIVADLLLLRGGAALRPPAGGGP